MLNSCVQCCRFLKRPLRSVSIIESLIRMLFVSARRELEEYDKITIDILLVPEKKLNIIHRSCVANGVIPESFCWMGCFLSQLGSQFGSNFVSESFGKLSAIETPPNSVNPSPVPVSKPEIKPLPALDPGEAIRMNRRHSSQCRMLTVEQDIVF